jgi:hypothetical protein
MLESLIVGAVVIGAVVCLFMMQMRKREKARKHEHCGGCGCCGSMDETQNSNLVKLQK